MFCLLTWALGLLMKISFVADLRKKLEDGILNFVPALNHHKILVAENTDAGKSQDTWKPVLVLMNVRYKSAFVVEAGTGTHNPFYMQGKLSESRRNSFHEKKNIHCIPVS